MDGKMLARLGAVVFVAIAITATVIEMTRKGDPAPVRTVPAFQPPADPLRATLRRCQQLGEAATSDPACLSAWSESRNHFVGRTPAPVTPQQNGRQ
ncbi:putative entry exclusion protein TrbK-alt [Brucella anthropi]|uniref:putative entry exclusion protein TrbK-alt n=1 Tax=Brucella anthropi TaxID=529 RepID=UPI0021653E00|nr:putative entry exclusion protein TrbK-alt [Brucella anthropi]UVV69219.1 putative entry exclusion protein TrbK-alt [Brucella anthropi]